VTRTLRQQPVAIEDNVPPLRVVVYGDPGQGKTSFALSFPKPLVVDTDDGLEGDTVKGKAGEKWNPSQWRDLNDLYFWLKENVEKKGYKTIVIDSLDTLCDLILIEATNMPTRGRDENAIDTTLTQSEKQDYGKVAVAIRVFFSNLKVLSREHGTHIVVTCGVRLPDPEQGRRKRTMDAQAKVEKIVTQWSNIYGELVVVQTDTGKKTAKNEAITEDHRILWTQASDPKRQGKTRFSALEPGVTDPTFTKIVGKIKPAPAAAKGTK
jgi:GTPase SAR1 family protein